MGIDDYIADLQTEHRVKQMFMKQKQLIDIYKQDPEAKEFIEKHINEFSEASYNDLTAIAPNVVKMKEVSVVIQNTHLLKRKKNINLLDDYFAGLTPQQLLLKYKYKNTQSLHTAISFLKKLVKKRFEKMIEEQLSLELKKVDKNELQQQVTSITFNLTSNQVKVLLVKAKHKNRINYKFHDEDVSMLYRKAQYIFKQLETLEQKKINKIFSKFPSPDDLSEYHFEQMRDILSRYRWVNKEGFFVPKVVDDAIILILTEKYNEKQEIDELFKEFN